MGLFSKLNGTIAAFFQIGGPSGAGWNNNGALALEARNAANTGFVNVRGALPTTDNDLATKAYVDTTASKPLPVSLEFNGNSALPNNSATEQWYVTTTTGPQSSVGDILWDDGTNTGTVTVIPAATGHTIVTTAAFSTGAVPLAAQQMYLWTGSAWLDIAANVSGVTYCVEYIINHSAATQDSVTILPAGAMVYDVRLVIALAYAAGVTISVGQVDNTSGFMGTGDNTPQVVGTYQVLPLGIDASSAFAVRTTITGSLASGSGYVIVFYTVPNA
jgi:hypothetical protein